MIYDGNFDRAWSETVELFRVYRDQLQWTTFFFFRVKKLRTYARISSYLVTLFTIMEGLQLYEVQPAMCCTKSWRACSYLDGPA